MTWPHVFQEVGLVYKYSQGSVHLPKKMWTKVLLHLTEVSEYTWKLAPRRTHHWICPEAFIDIIAFVGGKYIKGYLTVVFLSVCPTAKLTRWCVVGSWNIRLFHSYKLHRVTAIYHRNTALEWIWSGPMEPLFY